MSNPVRARARHLPIQPSRSRPVNEANGILLRPWQYPVVWPSFCSTNLPATRGAIRDRSGLDILAIFDGILVRMQTLGNDDQLPETYDGKASSMALGRIHEQIV